MPNIMGMNISTIFDNYIKKAAKSVPNVHFVKGTTRNSFAKFSNYQKWDIHYSKAEYLILINTIFSEILRNYLPILIKNEILTSLSNYSQENELKDITSKGSIDDIRKIFFDILDKYASQIEKYNIDYKNLFENVWQYYTQCYLESYACTSKKDIKQVMKTLEANN